MDYQLELLAGTETEHGGQMIMWEFMAWVNILLAGSVLAVIFGGLWNRHSRKKGIGWQFIRYTVIGISLPIAALLALNDALSGEAAAIIAGAMGYAFGRTNSPKSTDG